MFAVEEIKKLHTELFQINVHEKGALPKWKRDNSFTMFILQIH